MKKLLIIFVVLVFAFGVACAEPGVGGVEAEDKKPKSICTETRVTGGLSDCMECHIAPGWGIKKSAPYAEYKDSLPSKTVIIDRDGKPIVRYYLTHISDYDINEVCDWLSWNPQFKHLMIEIQSPGGSLFAAQRISALLDGLKAQGITIETRCNGFAASAGFYILVSGSKGHRYAARDAQLMWHELISFKMFDISSPADKEDEANVLRHLQDTANGRISRLTGVPAEELDSLTRKKEMWLNGAQSFELGFVDHLTD
jgi:ATP-dependent Clp protease protease subunit